VPQVARHAPHVAAATEGVAEIGRESESKRRNEARRSDRRKLKDERRLERQSAASSPVDEAAMMARFQELNEQRAAGTISEAHYEAQRSEIFVALGLEDPVETSEPSDDAEQRSE
jgi:hypothetical protein